MVTTPYDAVLILSGTWTRTETRVSSRRRLTPSFTRGPGVVLSYRVFVNRKKRPPCRVREDWGSSEDVGDYLAKTGTLVRPFPEIKRSDGRRQYLYKRRDPQTSGDDTRNP